MFVCRAQESVVCETNILKVNLQISSVHFQSHLCEAIKQCLIRDF